jgi:lysophospholipase L1-like esterase
MKYLIGAILIMLLLTTVMKRTTVPVKELTAGDPILAFGDSITFGYGVNPQESYPAILSQLSGHPVVNAGIPGETSDQGLRRLPSVLKEHHAGLLILCFGGNDIIQGLSREALRKNLVAMVRIANGEGMQVFLIGVPDITLVGLSTLPLYEEIAGEEQILLFDSLLEEILGDPSLKNDSIHPNARGYRLMAEEIYRAMKAQQMI